MILPKIDNLKLCSYAVYMTKFSVLVLIMTYSTFSFAEAKEKLEVNPIFKVAISETAVSSCDNALKNEWKIANLLR